MTSGGLRRYVEELAPALARQFPYDTYSLMSDQVFAMPSQAPPNLRACGPPHTRLERRWWLAGVPLAMRRSRAQIFHGTNFETPWLNLQPSVLSLFDLSPWKIPAWHSGAGRVRSRTPWMLRMGLATMVLVMTDSIRREAIEFFHLPPERVVVVAGAAAPLFQPPALVTPERAYFLFVGTLEPRKNVGALVSAWREVRRVHDVDLLLAGRTRADFSALPDEPGLKKLGEVTDEELPGLYANAVAMVYPSHYEGFGLPVLEAMQCGAMVIVSGDGSLREVAGEAALRATGPRDLVQAMLAALTLPDLTEDYRSRSLLRAAAFSWERAAQETRAVYGEAIARFG